MTSLNSLNSPTEYTIGWICALPLERAPAEEMLEEKHADPKGFKQPQTDNNVYTLGRIGGHNVVIASLPDGEYGTAPATGVAMSMLSTFPEIRFGLMVGIGAAIPRDGRDIRLGDVAVSRPDGKSGGVVQYDLGKALSDGEFVRKGSLNTPPIALRMAVAKIQTEHKKRDSKIPTYLSEMLKRLPAMGEARDGAAAYVYQGAKNDRLFEVEYDHAGGNNCNKCDPAKLIKRGSRQPEKLSIHYGVIASGNTLVKNARAREKLVKHSEEDCICFEMEAAGLMNQFPCLVIRGLCDYADSHKNDQWQPYAAATAAAYARELLHYLPVQDVGKVPTANETLNRDPNTSSNPPRASNPTPESRTGPPSGGDGSNNPPTGSGSSNPSTVPGTNRPPDGRGEAGSQTNDSGVMRTDAIYDGRWQHQWRLIWAGQHIQEINPSFASTQQISEIHLAIFTHTTWASCIVEVDIFHAARPVQGIPMPPTTICTEASGESEKIARPFYQQASTETITAGKPLGGGSRAWNRGAFFVPPVVNSGEFKFLGRRVMGCQGKSEEGGLNLMPLNASDYRWRLKDLNLAMGPGHRIYALAYGLFIEHYDPTEEPTTRILRVANDTQVALEVSKQTQFQFGEHGWYTSTKRHEICRAAEGIIFVYDLCHPHSPENVRRLYDLVMEEREEWQFANGKTHRGLLMGGRWADEERLLTSGLATKRPVPIGIVALGAERDPVDIAVSVEERERLARGLGGFTVDCSAEDGSGLEEVFMGVVEGVMEQREQRRRLMEERHSLLF
ncbi:hypothetical protein FQN52_001185 [Onygenales sp. PD_12]|nr:hypothetical protein FQN52_001185 [Onygenales sp. PD_12]